MYDRETRQHLLQHYAGIVTDNKKQRIEEVLAQRTRYITVVMEDLFNGHNTSAIIRTADCLGMQDVYVIESKHPFKLSSMITRGASKWVDVFKYTAKNMDPTYQCLTDLKSKGYQLVVTSPNASSISIEELELDNKIALIMGAEHTGVSEVAQSMADSLVHIPMVGFTGSMNVSVSAGIALYNLCSRLRSSSIRWQLSAAEKEELQFTWYRKCLHRPFIIDHDFLGY